MGTPGKEAPPAEESPRLLAFLVLHSEWYPKKIDVVQAARLLLGAAPCEAALLVVHRGAGDRQDFERLLLAVLRPPPSSPPKTQILGAGVYSFCFAPGGPSGLSPFFCADVDYGESEFDGFLVAHGGFIAGLRTAEGRAVGLTYARASIVPSQGRRGAPHRRTMDEVRNRGYLRLADLWLARAARVRLTETDGEGGPAEGGGVMLTPAQKKRYAEMVLGGAVVQVAAYGLAAGEGPAPTRAAAFTMGWRGGLLASAVAPANVEAPPYPRPLPPPGPAWRHGGEWPDQIDLEPPLRAFGVLIGLGGDVRTPPPHRTLDEGHFCREVTNSQVEAECAVCMDQRAEVLFGPCGHLVCCPPCARQLAECPICRAAIRTRTPLAR
jgi:hypothetical protein